MIYSWVSIWTSTDSQNSLWSTKLTSPGWHNLRKETLRNVMDTYLGHKNKSHFLVECTFLQGNRKIHFNMSDITSDKANFTKVSSFHWMIDDGGGRTIQLLKQWKICCQAFYKLIDDWMKIDLWYLNFISNWTLKCTWIMKRFCWKFLLILIPSPVAFRSEVKLQIQHKIVFKTSPSKSIENWIDSDVLRMRQTHWNNWAFRRGWKFVFPLASTNWHLPKINLLEQIHWNTE